MVQTLLVPYSHRPPLHLSAHRFTLQSTMLAATLFTLLPLLAATVTAAPSSLHKRYTNVKIESSADVGLCLTVAAPAEAGSDVFMGPCAEAIGWDINLGAGAVLPVLTTSGLALDGGPNAGAYNDLTIETLVAGQGSQKWVHE
jgi:hypothetical protein